jgi:ATP-binding cassette, subfamily B, multidrug efflux pump
VKHTNHHTKAATDQDFSSIRISQLLSHLTPLFKIHKTRLVLGFTALLAVDILQLTIPRILKHGIDHLEAGTINYPTLVRLAFFIILIAILVSILRFTWRNLIIGFSRLLEKAIRNKIFRHITKMDAPFFEKHTTGDIMAHASNDLISVQMACGMGIVAAVDALVMSTAAIGFMIHIHPKLTLLALLPMPFLALCTRILSGKLHRRFNTVQEQFAHLTEFSRSTLVSIRLIKAYTMERFQTKEFESLGKKYVNSNLQVARIQGLMFPISTLVGNIGMLLVLYFGGRLVIQGDITMGDFVAFITYLQMLLWPMMAIGWVANLVQRGLTSLRRVHTLLSTRSNLTTKKFRGQPDPVPPNFDIRSLSFTYPTGSRQILHNISLKIGPGILGITGRTGSGKSSICKILVRLYPVPDGTVYIDNQDVNTLALDDIRSRIAYVGQEPILFSETIANNLLLAHPSASQEELKRCTELAAIYTDIVNFPDGFNTLIGERGVKLSGGQRQRLALARALLSDRPSLIIDDGLSAVDVETENEIFSHLREHVLQKTVIIVSNRLKLLSMTDRTIIIEEGRIAHVGQHDQLLKESSFYKSMYDKQLRNQDEEVRGEA